MHPALIDCMIPRRKFKERRMDKPGLITIRISETLTVGRVGDEIGFNL